MSSWFSKPIQLTALKHDAFFTFVNEVSEERAGNAGHVVEGGTEGNRLHHDHAHQELRQQDLQGEPSALPPELENFCDLSWGPPGQ